MKQTGHADLFARVDKTELNAIAAIPFIGLGNMISKFDPLRGSAGFSWVDNSSLDEASREPGRARLIGAHAYADTLYLAIAKSCLGRDLSGNTEKRSDNKTRHIYDV